MANFLSNLFGQDPDEEDLQAIGPAVGDQSAPPTAMMPPPDAGRAPAVEMPDTSPLPADVPPDAVTPYQFQNPAVKQSLLQKLYGDKYSDDARQKIQDQNKEDASGPNWLAGLGALGAGLQGGNAAEAGMNFLKNQQNQRDAKLTAFDKARQGLVEGQKNANDLQTDADNKDRLAKERDPNSIESKAAQAAAIKMGIKPDIASRITAEQFKAQGPIFEKMWQAEQANLTRRDNLSAQRDMKMDAKQNAALTSTQQLLEAARGGAVVTAAEKDIYNSDKADTLSHMYGDPNKLSMPQVRLLASEIAKIASGGVPGMHELDGITPNTLTGKMSEITSSFTNKPTAANAAAFVKQYQDYADGLRKDAQKVILDKYGRIIDVRKSQLTPEANDILQEKYINRFKRPAEATVAQNVRMIGPDGKVRMVPKEQVAAAQKAGGKLADEQVAQADQ